MKKKKFVTILIILFALLVMVGIYIYVYIRNSNYRDNDIVNNKEDYVQPDQNMDDKYNLEDNAEVSNDNNIQDNYREEDVINYFESMGQEIENSKSFKEKFKEYFIIIVDFIFYDGKIKGYTFSELTGTAKAKIIAIALKMDSKIEEYVPGYKESISGTTGKIYTDIKEKLVTSYMDISTAICKDNKDECNKVKDIFSDVKDCCKIGWDFIKGLFKNGITKLKDWYEIYSGK